MTSLAFCLVLIPALIVAVLAVSEAEPKGDWAPQPALAGLAEAYGTTTFSWDIAESREVCARYTVPLNANPGVTDHGKVISAAVRLVALNGGGSVALEPGVYTIKSRVKLLSNVCLRGSGVAQTVLRAPTGGGGKDLKDGLIRADYLKFVAVCSAA